MGIMLSKKLARVGPADYYLSHKIAHWCPACKGEHAFAVDEPQANGARWKWDGNVETPTFTPLMNIRVGPTSVGKFLICHYRLRNGVIEYQKDCTHAFVGLNTQLPDFPASRVAQLEFNERENGRKRAS